MGLQGAGARSPEELAEVRFARRRPGYLPFAFVVVLVLYCLALAALLGLSTPNLGTLNRYRAVLLPYLVFLLLQNEYAALWLPRFRTEQPPASR